MKALMAAAIGIAAIISTPVLAQTTAPTSDTLSNPTGGKGGQTLSHDGSTSLTNSSAAEASKSPGAAASPHTGYSAGMTPDRKSTRLNSSHPSISYAVFCLKKK